MRLLSATRVAISLMGLAMSSWVSHAAAVNLLANPGFEDGTHNDAPPWGVGGWRGSVRATTTESHAGRRSLMLEGGGDEGGINSAVQIVPIDPTGATKYKLSAWIKVPAGTGRARVRWLFDDGNGAGQYTDIGGNTDWMFFDQGENEIIPPPGTQRIIFRIYFVGGQTAAYLDDCEMVGEPSGQATYPGVRGVIQDQDGKPVAGAVVFLKAGTTAQEFANYSAVTDGEGKYTLCGKDDGSYSVVAWKQGYSLSEEKTVNIATGGALATYNGTLRKGAGGRNLALATLGRNTVVADSDTGRSIDPQFPASNLFDGNYVSSRYYNNAAAERWVYVDLDPVGKGTFSVNEFVLYALGVTQMTQGWPGLGDVFPKDFAIEYTTKDPAAETEAGWTSHVAFAITDATPTFAPVVLRLAAPITARAIRLRATNPAGGGFGPVELQVNANSLARTTVSGVVKDATSGTPVAGATVYRFQPAAIQSDPDIYGYGNPPPFLYAEEIRKGTPYEYAQSKTILETTVTGADGRYQFDIDPGRSAWLTAAVAGFPYVSTTVTPAEDAVSVTQDLSLDKAVTVSGVIKDASGPVYNAVVQIGGAPSPYVAITGSDGKYSLTVPAGRTQIYADAYGHAGKSEDLPLSANLTKDVTLDVQAETAGVGTGFESADGWEIAKYDGDWKLLGTSALAVNASQNVTPGGKNSALVETVNVTDSAGKEAERAYIMLQRTAAKRVAVEAGKAYNIYFRAKTENWVSPEHTDGCHFEVQWLDASGAVVARTYSHPYWINPQPFWQTYSLGHHEGASSSKALIRIPAPPTATSLDLKIGWLRLPSGVTDEKPDGTNPAGSQLYVDDLVVDAVPPQSGGTEPKIRTIALEGTNARIAYDGVLRTAATVSGPWTAVAGAPTGANQTYTAPATGAERYYRASDQ